MQISFSVPSKTFLVGEYAVLGNYAGILINSSPKFQLSCYKRGYKSNGFKFEQAIIPLLNTKDPVQALLWSVIDVLEDYNIYFADPYEGAGGFGASSAKFLMLYSLVSYLRDKKFSINGAIGEYKNILSKYNGISSGADIIAQYTGGVTYVKKCSEPSEAVDIGWPFKDLSILIFKTDLKITTHEHVEQINLIDKYNNSVLYMAALVDAVYKALINVNATELINSVNQYMSAMKEMMVTHPNTIRILDKAKECDKILAIKGCGAMGADVILVICGKNEQTHAKAFLIKCGLKYIASIDKDLSSGLELL